MAWRIADCSDSPRTQLAALSTVGHADEQINRLYHLDKIPPLDLNEEESKEQIDEELADIVLEVMSQKNNRIEGLDGDSSEDSSEISSEGSSLAASTAQSNSAREGVFKEAIASNISNSVTEVESYIPFTEQSNHTTAK